MEFSNDTEFDADVKLKAGVKRKTVSDADQQGSSNLPKKPAKQPPIPKVNDYDWYGSRVNCRY